MKTYRIKLFTILVCCISLCFLVQGKVHAASKEYEGFQYHYETYYRFDTRFNRDYTKRAWNEYGIVITDYTGDETEVVIPDKIDGIPVTEISPGCFWGNLSIKKVAIPDSVTVLGRGIFRGCKNLEEVKLPDNGSLKKLEMETFAYCESLKSIVIPKGCNTICEDAFYHCISLHTVTVNRDLKRPDKSECMEIIEESAFEGCEKLQNIDLSLSTMHDRSFKGCKSLRSIRIGAIKGKEVFANCTSLEEVSLLRSEYAGIWLEERTFFGCKNLKRIYCEGYPFAIRKNAFKNIHSKAVFIVQKKYVKEWKRILTKKTGFRNTMKIKTK